MHQTIPQRTITISIVGSDADALVYYSYVSPVSGLVYIDAPVCDILVDRPIYTLYVLDYSSSANGWTIRDISPAEGSPSLKWEHGAKHLSIMTINPYKMEEPNRPIDYFIHYTNTLTGAVMKRDPQEENVPPRQDPPTN